MIPDDESKVIESLTDHVFEDGTHCIHLSLYHISETDAKRIMNCVSVIMAGKSDDKHDEKDSQIPPYLNEGYLGKV